MGTRFDILVINQNRWKSLEIWSDIIFELRRLDQVFNRFDDTSETSRINRKAILEPVHLSPEMWSILKSCQIYYARTLGLFDITLNNFSKVFLDEKEYTATFLEKEISLDFGGYAKGYALMKIKDLIHQAGVKHCFVNFGNSSILGIGHHPYGDAWRVSIENPYKQGDVLDEVSLKNLAFSVSGNTPSYTGHIIRPTSKEPIRGQKVISIISEDPLDAEVLSTVFMISNAAEKRQITENFKIQKNTEY